MRVSLRESIKVDALNWILANLETFVVKEERKKFKKYAKKISGGQMTIEYSQINGSGRLYAKKAQSLQGFSRHIRSKLADVIYHDIDMENCHPVFLLELCRQNGWETPELRHYVNNREAVLKVVHQDRSKAKLIMLSLMYGSKSNAWVQIPFRNEMNRIARLVYDKYPIGAPNPQNPYFSRMSLLLQDIEHTVLMEMANFFTREGYEIGVYVFDGMMIYRKDKGPLPEEILRNCETHIRESTVWDIKLTEKILP